MRPLIQFLIRNYIVFLFFLLEGIAISMFINNSYYQKAVFVNATNGLTGYLYEVRTSITQYFSLKDINEQLAIENAQLRSQQENSFIKTDNKIFIKGDTLYRQQYQYIIAKVINNSTNHTSNYLTLNKGAKHGIKKDMAVISPSGVVGVVNEVSDNFCSVISLLHPKTRISAKLKKNDYVGTVIWEGNSPTMGCLKDVPTHVKIARGDTVITSGYSLVFPEGMMIGTIDYYDIGHGNDFYHINIKLSTDFNNIRYVYVVNNLMKDELENLEKSSQKE